MELELYRRPQSLVLWRVNSFGRQRVPAGRAYWFDNHEREPADAVVAQVTLAGQMTYRDHEGDHLVQPGQLLLFAYHEATSYGLTRADRGAAYECFWLNLQGAGLREHLNAFRREHGSIVELGPRAALLREMNELAAMAAPVQSVLGSAGGSGSGSVTPTELAAAVHRFVLHLFEHAEQRHDRMLSPVQRAVEQMLRQPTQPWSLKELADRYGCSREHLSRVFLQRTGETPAAFLAQARLRRAMPLIMQTDLPLAAVAEQAGFASVHTLARQVRQATGRAPSALRGEGVKSQGGKVMEI